MESPHLDEAKVLAFWSWFKTIANDLGDNFDDSRLLDELDARVSELGDVAWELGPGSSAENVLAISPDGARKLLPLTQRIVSMAPDIPRWEFLPARPPRPSNLTFSITATAGGNLDIDARGWRYVLFRFPDGTFDLLLEQRNMSDANDDDRYTAAVVFLDGLLGEAMRLLQIRDVETVVTLPPDQARKASSVGVLANYLREAGGRPVRG